jgi:hypothetical protein
MDRLKNLESATSSQSLMVIRCCGSLVPEEHPKVRTKLVQEIWNTLESLGKILGSTCYLYQFSLPLFYRRAHGH